ncbi:MAG: hypothetical protein WED05_12010 [Candidatus Atabeyarchaeum deiterrae]
MHQGESKVSTKASERWFLVSDLDNTVIDSRVRFNRSIAEALNCSTDAAPRVSEVSDLSRVQRSKFYDVFLSGKYMDLDTPVKGSVAVLSRLRSMNIGITYLTGRHHSKRDSLRSETLASLSKFGFPMPNDREVLLCMKPDRMMSTAKYKRGALEELGKVHELAVGIDDEPSDLKVMADFIPMVIGIALSPQVAREITSKVRVPIARDWYEVESIISKSNPI